MFTPIPKPIWLLIHKKYDGSGVKKTPMLSFPMRILSNFDFHYALYDANGDVHDGAKTFREAVRKHKETGLYFTRIIERKD